MNQVTIFTIESKSINKAFELFPDLKIIKDHEPVESYAKCDCCIGNDSMPLGFAYSLKIFGNHSRRSLTKKLGKEALVRGVKHYYQVKSFAKRGNLDETSNWFELLTDSKDLVNKLDIQAQKITYFKGQIENDRPRLIVHEGETEYAIVYDYDERMLRGYEEIAYFKITNNGGLGYTLLKKMDVEFEFPSSELLNSWEFTRDTTHDFCIVDGFFIYIDDDLKSPIGVKVEGYAPREKQELREYLFAALGVKCYSSAINTLYEWLEID